MTHFSTALVALVAISVFTQTAPPGTLLSRRYVDGERLQYVMKAQNDGATYEVRITGTTVKKSDGSFVEEFAWSDLVANGAPRNLSATSQAFRLAVTLSGGTPFEMPDLAKAQGLIGPVTDLMTFYADLFLVVRESKLEKAGDRFYFANPALGVWTDGVNVLLGEDHVDFDITLVSADAGVAGLLIKHVPPAQPKIRLPADWMRTPIAGSPNNFVQIRKNGAMYAASVGKETFDVRLMVSLADGKILSASMHNPVTKVTSECANAALTQCGPRKLAPTLRTIEMSLVGRP